MHERESRSLRTISALLAAFTVACVSRPATVEQQAPSSAEQSRPSIPEAMPSRAQAPEPAAKLAHPINLARTSLASVDASSTNGPREMENPYYGVVNAFDDGENWIEGFNYTYWLPGNEEEPYIDVHFDAPVTVTRVEVKGAPGTVFMARLEHSDGGETLLPSTRVPVPPPPAESTPAWPLTITSSPLTGMGNSAPLGSQDSQPMMPGLSAHYTRSPFAFSVAVPFSAPPASGSIELSEPATLVQSLRIDFTRVDLEHPERVHEVRVLGFPPEGVSFDVRKPRVLVSERNVLLSGKAALDAWQNSLFESLTPDIVERDDAFVVTYFKSGEPGKPIFRVSVSKTTGRSTTEPLVTGW